uniref:Guanylyl cyclase n=1 Tax=Chenopodium quinoa TaxID=63459 RepID=A0A803M3K4_CHEQI
MWPLCEFVNKLLSLEEVTQNSSDCSLSGSCSLYSLTDGIDHDVILPRLRFIEVPHVNQLSNWDCGLACVLMVLQTIGINNCSLHTLEKLCGTRSRSWLEDYHISELCGSNLGYTGHYVVICGYDADKDEFEIRDPASSRKYQKISSKHLDEARKSFGTDEDLLLISIDQRYNKEAFPLISGHANEDP